MPGEKTIFAIGMELLSLFSYYVRRHGAHGLHSPFVFDWYNACVLKRPEAAALQQIEATRKLFSRDSTPFQKLDLGTGLNNRSMRVSRLVHDSMNKRMGEIFFQTIDYMGYKQALELGTCLGVGTSYLSAGTLTELVSVEACPATLGLAKKFIGHAGLQLPELIQGDFSVVLEELTNQNRKFDFVLFDGNHRGSATIEYYKQVKPLMTENGLLVFDDIRWSNDMWKAWKEITDSEKNCYCIDLGKVGMVFLSSRAYGQYFYLKK